MTEEMLEPSPERHQSQEIRVILADDHPLLRQALRDVLEKQPDFKVIAEACDGEEAVRLATELVPDVVIMDKACLTSAGWRRRSKSKRNVRRQLYWY